MYLSRRSILTSLIAAPAVISIDNLMPVRLFIPTIYGDAIHDDYEGLLAWMKGERVNILPRGFRQNGEVFEIGPGIYHTSKGVYVPENAALLWKEDMTIGNGLLTVPKLPKKDFGILKNLKDELSFMKKGNGDFEKL